MRNNQKGFTLVEIVLVLAIAGLIFAIVFLAVSGAQRARRDTARKSDLSRYGAALEQYAGNNSGNYPATDGTAVGDSYFCLSASGCSPRQQDPDGTFYAVQAGAPTAAGQIQYDAGSNCSAAAGARTYCIRIFQESGGSYQITNQ